MLLLTILKMELANQQMYRYLEQSLLHPRQIRFFLKCDFSRLNDHGTFDAKLVSDHYFKRRKVGEQCAGNASAEHFTMVLPPPNVTGNLHVGHALTVAIEDSICRFQKMMGKKVLWIPGFDHAGIATQTVVEKQINRRLGKKREELTDAEFLKTCESWKDERIRDITEQLNSLGCDLDWPLLFYTMDQNFTKAVAVAFCKLYEMGLIVREKRMVQSVGEKEPSLKEQWFFHLDQMNKDLLEHLDTGKMHLDPSNVRGIFVEFLKFKDPWCLSRQLVWGHRIPAYFVESSRRWIVAPSEEEARKQLLHNEQESTLTQDTDRLDTWFSSSLIPIVVAGWPEKEVKGNVLNLMETGYDIVGFWVAKMLMVCQRLTGHYPFSNVLVHGLIQDSQHRKMSKSLGNVIDPLDVINGISLQKMVERMRTSNLPLEEMDTAEVDLKKRFPRGIKACSADGLRFALLRHDLSNFQIKIDIPKFAEEGNRFCNKIWNMCKYAEKVFEANQQELGSEQQQQTGESIPNEEDKQIMAKLKTIAQIYVYHMDRNRPHIAFDRLYKFILTDLCDTYLETTKKSLWKRDPERLSTISATLREVISTVLCLLQPFMPFVCTFLLDTLCLESGSQRERLTKNLTELTRLTEEDHRELVRTLPVDEEEENATEQRKRA